MREALAPENDTFAALVLARAGSVELLDALFERICSNDPPEVFATSWQRTYDQLAAVGPVTEEPARSDLLQRLKTDGLCGRAKVFIWAVTGTADAFGMPLSASVASDVVVVPQASSPVVQEAAEVVADTLIRRPFDPDAGLTVAVSELPALGALDSEVANAVARSVVAEAGRLGSSSGSELYATGAAQVLSYLPANEAPLGDLYSISHRTYGPILSDIDWQGVMARTSPTHAIEELAPLIRESEHEALKLDVLNLIAESAQAAAPGPPTDWEPDPNARILPASESPPESEAPSAVARPFPGAAESPLEGVMDEPEAIGDTDIVAASPGTAWPHLVAPDEAIVAEEFMLEVGLRSEKLHDVSGTGRMVLPAESFDLEVEVTADGFELRSGTTRFTLPVTTADRYPIARLTLVALEDEALQPLRTIGATFFVGGAMRGHVYRLVRVLGDSAALGQAPRPVTDPALPFDLTPEASEQTPDLTIQIADGNDAARTSLIWTARSPHFEVELPDEDLKSDVGEEPAVFARRIVDYSSTAKDPIALFDYLGGTGKEIATKIPAEIRRALVRVAERGANTAPAVLIVSADPYIPWELAVLDIGPFAVTTDSSPFLAAHVALGRWPLSARRPPCQPPTDVSVVERVVVSGEYDRVPNWPRLEEAEAEAEEFAKAWTGSSRVDASYEEVRGALRGIPPADVLHFALHGQLSDGAQNGLVLIDRDPAKPDVPAAMFLQPEQVGNGDLKRDAPFVFLNACQVGSGTKVLGNYAGMAVAFLKIGASSVVAPLWSINDKVARDAARHFYAHALDSVAAEQEPVAEVLRQARATLTETAVRGTGGPGASTYLAYQFFGHPKLKLRRT